MSEDNAIFVGASDADQYLLLKFGNRHGLIAGATGTGKTVTLQTIAEGFSAYGVPVFLADVKGDLTGISQPGNPSDKLLATLKEHDLTLEKIWITHGHLDHAGGTALLKEKIGRASCRERV